jgi:hypothetical protein
MRKCSQKAHAGVLGSTVAALALLGFVANSAGCDDNDNTDLLNGGSGGMAGRAGSGGTGGGGRGGGAGGTTGGTGGTGGSAGTAGSAGTGGSGENGGGDAGPDADTGDGGPVLLTDQQIAEAICASYDALAACDAEPDCVSALVAQIVLTRTNAPGCVTQTNAYFTCFAHEPIESFTCDGNTAIFASDTVNCDEENCDFLNCQVDPDVCP